MRFPFSVVYNKILNSNVNSDNKEEVLKFIKDTIEEDKADNVVTHDWSVTYKGSISRWNVSRYRTVDDGIFTLIENGNSWYLRYKINMLTLFRDTFLLSLVFGIFGQLIDGSWWLGLIAYLWFCGVNWLINIVRHEGIVSNIAADIDRHISGIKDAELPELEKIPGKLKSWF